MRISVGSGIVTSPVAVSDYTDGRLQATPAYYQTALAEAVKLDSADKMIATKTVPQTDFELQALSRHIASVTSQGSGTLEIWSDGLALEPDGKFNNSIEAWLFAVVCG